MKTPHATVPDEDETETAAVSRKKIPLGLKLLLGATVVFCVLFPKGGVTVANIPITWGYLLLGGMAVGTVLVHLCLKRAPFPRQYVGAYLLTLPFALIVVGSFAFNGWLQTGFAVAVLTNVVVLPLMFLLVFSAYFNRSATISFLIRLVYWSVLGAAIYGIILFAYKQKTGDFVEVPYLTTNGQQEATLDDRNNARGDIFKLVSTYNNGNIYGVCTLMLLPLCGFAARARPFQSIPFIAVFLTLSRTAWGGIFLLAMLKLGGLNRKLTGRILMMGGAFLLLLGAVAFYLHVSGKNWDWVFDSSLGSRVDQVDSVIDLDRITLLPDRPFDTISEMTYINMANSFGILGLAAYLLAMAGPLVIALSVRKKRPGGYPAQSAAIKGVFVYLVVSFIDGAYMLIPVMAFYWFLMVVALRKEPVEDLE